MERKLDLTLSLAEDGSIKTVIQDLESRLSKTVEGLFSPDEHPEFDTAIGAELYSWLSLMADEMGLDANDAFKFDFGFLNAYEPTEVDITVEWYDDDLAPMRRTATAAAWFSDWFGECEMCPANDTTLNWVTVSTRDGKIRKIVFHKNDSDVRPYFEDLMESIRPTMVCHHWDEPAEDYIECAEEHNSEPRFFIGMTGANRYVADNDVPFAKAVESVGICKNCGHPVFPSREPGVWGYCHHCDAYYSGPDDLMEEG